MNYKNTGTLVRHITGPLEDIVKAIRLEGKVSKHTFVVAGAKECTVRMYEIFNNIEAARILMPKLFVKQKNGLLALTADIATIIETLEYLQVDYRDALLEALIEMFWELGHPIRLTVSNSGVDKTVVPEDIQELIDVVMDSRKNSTQFRKACAQAIINHPKCDEVFLANKKVKVTVLKLTSQELQVVLLSSPKVVKSEAKSMVFAREAKPVDLNAYDTVVLSHLKRDCKAPFESLYEDCKKYKIKDVFEAALENILDHEIDGISSGILPVKNTMRSIFQFLYGYENKCLDRIYPLRFPAYQWFSPMKTMIVYGDKTVRQNFKNMACSQAKIKPSKIYQLFLSVASTAIVHPQWQVVCEFMRGDVPYCMILDVEVDRMRDGGDRLNLGWHMTASIGYTSDLITRHPHTTVKYNCVSNQGDVFDVSVHDYNWGAAIEWYFERSNPALGKSCEDITPPSYLVEHGFENPMGISYLRNYLGFMTIPEMRVQAQDDLQIKLKFLSDGFHIKALDRLISVVANSNSSIKCYFEAVLLSLKRDYITLRVDAKNFLTDYQFRHSTNLLSKVEYVPYSPVGNAVTETPKARLA